MTRLIRTGDNVTEKKARWKKILAMEARAREMELRGEANRRSSQSGAGSAGAQEPTESEKPAAAVAFPNQGQQGQHVIQSLLEFSLLPALVLIALVSIFTSFNLSLPHFVLFAVLAGIYNVPAIIAFTRGHNNRWAILVLNVVGGWTAIAWIAALVWSLANPPTPQVIYVTAPPPSPPKER